MTDPKLRMYYLIMRQLNMYVWIIAFSALALLLSSCATQAEEAPARETPPATEGELPEPEPEPEPEPSPEVAETLVPEDTTQVPEEEIYLETEEFVISAEMYETTFSEVEQVIEQLNQIIADRDFPLWQTFLTDEYIDTYSDPDVLRERSESPVLRRDNIELRSLEDYFTWVVVRSRVNARLDDLEFIGTDKVEAIMRVRDQGVILYQLKRVNDRWKIDVY